MRIAVLVIGILGILLGLGITIISVILPSLTRNVSQSEAIPGIIGGVVVLIFSFGTGWFDQNLPLYLDTYPITDNILLSAIYAGLVGGIGGGAVLLRK